MRFQKRDKNLEKQVRKRHSISPYGEGEGKNPNSTPTRQLVFSPYGEEDMTFAMQSLKNLAHDFNSLASG